jgi:hypothetical protein
MNKQLLALVVLTTITNQSVVIGIGKKEDKWNKKWGLASFYNNLVHSFLICSTVKLQSYNSQDRPNIQKKDCMCIIWPLQL